jgi:hypothetical protein
MPEALETNCVLWLPMTWPATTAYDVSTRNHDASATNANTTPLWGNWSMLFDGVDDYLQCADSADYRFDANTADFSVAMWLTTTDLGTTRILVDKRDAVFDGWFMGLAGVEQPFITIQALAGLSSTLPVAIAPTWSHVAFTVDRDASVKIYVNGIQGFSSNITAFAMATTAPLRIGCRGHTSPTFFHQGRMDDLRIFNRALTSNEVYSIWQRTTH